MRRVVVTGLGLVTPLGCGVEYTWKRLINGESGLGNLTRFEPGENPCHVAGDVPYGAGEGQFNIDDWVDVKEQKKMDTFIAYGRL